MHLFDHRESVELLLDSLPGTYAGTRCVDSALGPAVEAAYLLSQHIGGKVVVVQAALPTVGTGRLKAREAPRTLGSDKERELVSPDTTPDAGYYKNRAADFSKQQLSVDFFLFNINYADVATLGSLSRYTSGQVYWYSSGGTFSAEVDGVRFHADLCNDLTRTTAFEAVMRVRATKGVSITSFYGNFFIRGADLLALPNATPETAFNVELSFDPNAALAAGSVVSVQSALLYTSSSGERRIAVHTLARPVVTMLADLFKSVDADVVANMMAKVALDETLKKGLPSARKYLHAKVVNIIRAYRQASQTGAGGLGHMQPRGPPGSATAGGVPPGAGGAADLASLLPDCLQTLPLLSLGLAKSPAFRGGEVVRTDERAALVYRLLTMPVVQSRKFVYPHLYPLHTLAEDEGRPIPAGAPEGGEVEPPHPFAGPLVRLPATRPLNMASLAPDGALLLDNGVELYLWVGRAAPDQLVEALWGEDGVPNGMDPRATLPLLANDFSKRVNAIVRALRADAASAQRLRIVRDGSGDANEHRFHWHIVEEKHNFSGGMVTYQEVRPHNPTKSSSPRASN